MISGALFEVEGQYRCTNYMGEQGYKELECDMHHVTMLVNNEFCLLTRSKPLAQIMKYTVSGFRPS